MIRGPEWAGRVWLTGVLVAVVSAVSVGVRYGEWFGSWGETASALEISTVLTYPLVAGVAAWFASASKRQRFDWMTESASRGPLFLRMRSAWIVAAPAAVGAISVGLVITLMTASEANFGAFNVVAVAPVLAGYLTAACLGVLLARWLPVMVSPVAAIVLVYAVGAILDTGNPSLKVFAAFVVADPRERTYMAAVTWVLLVKTLWLLAFAWLLIAMAITRSNRWLVPLGASCLLAVPLVLTGDSGLERVEAAYEPVCHDAANEIRVCMSAARDHAYDDVRSAIEPVAEKLDGLEGSGWAFEEESIATDPFPDYVQDELVIPFGVTSGVSGNSHVVDARMMQADIARRLLGGCASAPGSSGDKPVATARDVVHVWLLTQLGISTDGSEGYAFPNLSEDLLDYSQARTFVESFEGLSHAERVEWFKRHGHDLLRCTLSLPEAVSG